MAGKNITAGTNGVASVDTTATKKRRLRPPKNRVVTTLFVAAVKSGLIVGASVLVYILVFFAAVRVVPTIMSFVGNGTGLSPDMTMVQLISLWIAPSVFFIGLVFVAVLAIIRGVWRIKRKVSRRFENWVFGTTEGNVTHQTGTKKPTSRGKGAR